MKNVKLFEDFTEEVNEAMPMDGTRERLLDFLTKEVKRSGQQINTTDIILDFLTNEFHEEDEYERIIDTLKKL